MAPHVIRSDTEEKTGHDMLFGKQPEQPRDAIARTTIGIDIHPQSDRECLCVPTVIHASLENETIQCMRDYFFFSCEAT